MAKKEFKTGLDQLLNPTHSNQEKEAKKEKFSPRSGYKRKTFIIREDLIEMILALAYYDRKKITEKVEEALETYINSEEKEKLKKALELYKNK